MIWHATNSYKFHVICSDIYIYIYQYFVRYKNDLKCNQIYAIFLSFVLKNEFVYISSYSKIQKWPEMQLIHANFMSLILKLCVYIYIMVVKDTKIILNMQPIHANFTSLVLKLYIYIWQSKIQKSFWKCNQFIQILCYSVCDYICHSILKLKKFENATSSYKVHVIRFDFLGYKHNLKM